MRFGEALIFLGSQRLVARQAWSDPRDYLVNLGANITREPGIYLMKELIGLSKYTPSDEDLFALDWIEASTTLPTPEKEQIMATKAKKAAANKADITPDDIRAAIGHIEGQILGAAEVLITDLSKSKGLKFTTKPGWHIAKLMGIEAQSSVSDKEALKNWCNAARRSLN